MTLVRFRLPAIVVVAAAAVALSSPGSWLARPGPAVYQGKVVNQTLALGPQSNPTVVTQTPELPAGKYLVNYSVGTVMGPSDFVVCAAAPASQGHGNDGLFGGTGNGSSTSATGPGGVYGNAVQTDVITVAAGDAVRIVCNHTNGSSSSYVANASVTALKVDRAYVNSSEPPA